ncbi:BRCT domain-containing protein [Pantoea sp. At-9b]|uniref:BRCT domain-containing protein n=1 Tax=Pantoea sp. (strain At-9b) TaxID=592316 RepID=UPI0001B3EEFB|nr:BRCT domain-containing protein [Pantoea sp. At-9b]ADU70699.1 BRCT domain protein [Pantoea sp. At-9b]
MEEMHFVYINARGHIKAHSLVQVSHSEEHIQGVCINTHMLKTYRKDRILKQTESGSLASESVGAFSPENYRHLFTLSPPKEVTFDICFTGFKKADKERLIECATANGMTVRSSVTQNLQLLCCGYNAGPTKVTAARMKGVVILDEEQFADFVKTGEIPEV